MNDEPTEILEVDGGAIIIPLADLPAGTTITVTVVIGGSTPPPPPAVPADEAPTMTPRRYMMGGQG